VRRSLTPSPLLPYTTLFRATGWVSSVGAYVNQFEKIVADFAGAGYGVAAVNGTNALHIALMLSGVQRGDYVLLPNITFIASANRSEEHTSELQSRENLVCRL